MTRECGVHCIIIMILTHVLGIEKLFDDEDLVLKKEDEVSTAPVKVEARTLHLT